MRTDRDPQISTDLCRVRLASRVVYPASCRTGGAKVGVSGNVPGRFRLTLREIQPSHAALPQASLEADTDKTARAADNPPLPAVVEVKAGLTVQFEPLADRDGERMVRSKCQDRPALALISWDMGKSGPEADPDYTRLPGHSRQRLKIMVSDRREPEAVGFDLIGREGQVQYPSAVPGSQTKPRLELSPPQERHSGHRAPLKGPPGGSRVGVLRPC